MNFAKLGTRMAVSLLLTACHQIPVKLAEINNGDNATFVVTLSEIKAENFTHINRSASPVVARGSDDVLARTNPTTLTIYEMRTEDGGRREDTTPASFFRLTATKMVKNAQGNWSRGERIYIGHLAKDASRQYRIIALNTGNKAFKGDIVFHDYLDSRLKFCRVDNAYIVHDQTRLKEALAYLPFVGMAAMAMDQYNVLNEKPEMTVTENDGRLVVKFPNVNIEPMDGIIVELTTDIVLPDINAMRATSVSSDPASTEP